MKTNDYAAQPGTTVDGKKPRQPNYLLAVKILKYAYLYQMQNRV